MPDKNISHSDPAQQQLLLDVLWKLEDKINGSAVFVGWLLGIVGLALLGLNTDSIYEFLWSFRVSYLMLDILVGAAHIMGLVLVLASYPAYKTVLKAQRKKYATQMLQFVEKLTNG
jgi:hypothetical protein